MAKSACLELFVSFPEDVELSDQDISAAAAKCARLVTRELTRYRKTLRKERLESTKSL
jgi:hypothetical protein